MRAAHINDPEHFQQQAATMRRLADAMNDRAREDMLQLAKHYDLLGQRAQVRAGEPHSDAPIARRAK